MDPKLVLASATGDAGAVTKSSGVDYAARAAVSAPPVVPATDSRGPSPHANKKSAPSFEVSISESD